ncbi:hypothetical protein [Catelliglobosispora koreensis]|uniref:hypothetical protein n=1 Tax=Catelliglobosispora koreensis TaxID=129052 RepID=UPI0003733334|nr:hypothetical protein [Catelliglobosispora koreensis]
MTAHHDQHTEPAEVQHDEHLAHKLATGQPGLPQDPLSILLAACRDDIRAAENPAMPLLANAAHVAVRGHRRRTLLAIAAATLVSGGAAAVVLARDAQPGSPLWPITELVYTEHADLALIRMALGDARAAITQGRYTDAQIHLDEAARLLTRITPGTPAQQLAAEIGTLRQELAAHLAAPAQQSEPASQTPGARAATPASAGGTTGAPTDPGSPGQRPATPTPGGQPPVPPGRDRPQPGEQQRTTTRGSSRPPR